MTELQWEFTLSDFKVIAGWTDGSVYGGRMFNPHRCWYHGCFRHVLWAARNSGCLNSPFSFSIFFLVSTCHSGTDSWTLDDDADSQEHLCHAIHCNQVLLISSSRFPKDIDVLVAPWGTGRALQKLGRSWWCWPRRSASGLQGKLDKLLNFSDLQC